MMNRRRFLETALAATTVSLRAQSSSVDAPNWGGPVLDIHLHGKGPDGEWTHMQGSGVTHALLLLSPNAEAHAKEEIAKHPGRLKYSVAIDPARENAIETLRNSIKSGAIGFGEMKSRAKADGPEMRRVYDLASELGVP